MSTLTVQPSSQRTNLKFLPRLALLLRKHTLMIFTCRKFSLPAGTVGDIMGEPNGMVGDMLLQDRVLLSPDITNTHKERVHYSRETHMTVSVSFRGFLLPHMNNTKGPITAESTRVQHKILSDSKNIHTSGNDSVAFHLALTRVLMLLNLLRGL